MSRRATIRTSASVHIIKELPEVFNVEISEGAEFAFDIDTAGGATDYSVVSASIALEVIEFTGSSALEVPPEAETNGISRNI